MSKIHLAVLDKERQNIFRSLANFKSFGYLAGGTALSLQITHRESFDFDIFVDKPISNSFRNKVNDQFGKIDYYVNSSDQISFRTLNNIHITFLWYYFKPLFPLINTEFLPLAFVKDIAADKAHTIGRRAVWRDYVDFFFLLKRQLITLGEIIVLAKKKFQGEFNEVLFLQQLVFFQDLEEAPITFIRDTFTASEIRSFLEEEVALYSKKIIQ